MRNKNLFLLTTDLIWPNTISWTSKFTFYLIKTQPSLITPFAWITRVFALHFLLLRMPFSLALSKSLKIQILTRTVRLIIVSTCWWLDLSIFNTDPAQVSSPLQWSPPGHSIGFCIRGGSRDWSLDGTDRLHSLAVPSELSNGWVTRWQTYSLPLYFLVVGPSESPQLLHLYNENNTSYTQHCWRLEWSR